MLLILLLLKIYQKKDLCSESLKIFKNKYDFDTESFLKDYIPKFKSIISEADEIIINNNYNYFEFFGIILC